MKKINLMLLISLFLLSNGVAQQKEFGLGIIIGSPSGFSAKYFLNSTEAIDFGMGYAFSGKNNTTNFHADYLIHNSNVIKTEYQLPLYYGIGGRMKIRHNAASRIGVRGVLGITYYPVQIPIDIFLEVVPVFNIIPSTELDMEAGLGFRYYFK